MKKLLTLTALAGFLAAQQCSALLVNESRTSGYYQFPGGEFTIQSVAPDPAFNTIYNLYAAVATLNGGFQTFCISETATVLSNPKIATLDPNGVAVGTAWLYWQFGKGTLAYNYTAGAGRVASAWSLQNAIWELQGFTPVDAAAAASYVNLATTHFGSLANAELPNSGQFDVAALRMTYQGAVSQPMLALSPPLPDGGATLMLLGLALSGLGAFGRRFRV